MKISAIVMASGFSKRMGKNKLLCELNGKSIVERVLDIVAQCSLFECIVVTQYVEILGFAKKRNMHAVYNEHPQLGQSTSIKLGVENAQNVDGYAFFLADQPLLSPVTVAMLAEAFINNPEKIVVPRYVQKTGSPVFFPASLSNKLLVISGDYGGRSVICKYPDRVIYADIDEEMEAFDIDDEDDLLFASKYIKEREKEK
ncbi:MAG: nucleotidyltransferase family protein [Candidatus Humimicrobiaceae bacterium]